MRYRGDPKPTAFAAMELAINLPLIVFWQAFGEAVALLEEAQSPGVELPTAARVLEAFDRAAQAGNGGMDGVRMPAWASGKGAA